MRLFPSFQSLRNPGVRATSLSVVAGAFAGLAIIACTDSSQKSITAPSSSPASGPRNSTIFNAGFANAGKVDVCVDGGSPIGTYTFKHVGFLSPNEIGVVDAAVDGANGGDGTTTPNAPDNTNFDVARGGCVTVETRTTPDHGFPGSAECPIFLDTWQATHAYSTVPLRGVRDSNGHGQYVSVAGTSGALEPVWNTSGGLTTDGGVTWQDQGLYPTSGLIGGHWCSGFPDTWSGITLQMSSIPATALYSKTDCFLDQGDLPAIPNSGSPGFQCGTGNAHTRAYANHEHGAVILYYFGAAPPSSSGCVATIGWFKNQGNSQVPTTPFFGTAASWRQVLDTKPKGNDYYNLAFQYIAAKLGIGGGTPPAAVGTAITNAESFFTGRALGSTAGWVAPSLTSIAATLDNFNNGQGTTWPHCT